MSSQPIDLSKHDQKRLFNKVYSVLKKRFGKMPGNGIVAGQAVSSAIFEVLNFGLEGPFKDLDLFISDQYLPHLDREHKISAREFPSTNTELNSQRISKFREEVEKNSKRHSSVKKGKRSISFKNESSAYGENIIKKSDCEGYIITGVSSLPNNSHINIINIKRAFSFEDTELGLLDPNTRQSDADLVINGFDLNIAQSAIDLTNKKITWTNEFQQFLFRPSLKVVNYTTPTSTALRFAKKASEMPWVEADFATEMDKLQKVNSFYEYVEDTVLKKTEVPSIDGVDHESGGDSETERYYKPTMPGVCIGDSKFKTWSQYHRQLSPFFDIGDVRFSFYDEKAEAPVNLYRPQTVDREKHLGFFRDLFGDKIFEASYFWKMLSNNRIGRDIGGIEMIVANFNTINAISSGQGKEARARQAIIKESIVPFIEKYIDKILKEESNKSGELLDNEVLRVVSPDDFSLMISSLGVSISSLDRKPLRGIKPETFSIWMNCCRDEPMMLEALTEEPDQRKSLFDTFRYLRKRNCLYLFGSIPNLLKDDQGNRSYKEIMDVLREGPEAALRVAERYKVDLKKNGAVPIIPDHKVNGVSIRELSRGDELLERGVDERHCLGGYSSMVESGESIILQLDGKTPEGHSVSSTAEVSPKMMDDYINKTGKKLSLVCTQNQGKKNRQAHPVLLDALDSFLRRANTVIEKKREGRSISGSESRLFEPLLESLEPNTHLNLPSNNSEYPKFKRVLIRDIDAHNPSAEPGFYQEREEDREKHQSPIFEPG